MKNFRTVLKLSAQIVRDLARIEQKSCLDKSLFCAVQYLSALIQGKLTKPSRIRALLRNARVIGSQLQLHRFKMQTAFSIHPRATSCQMALGRAEPVPADDFPHSTSHPQTADWSPTWSAHLFSSGYVCVCTLISLATFCTCDQKLNEIIMQVF